MKKFFDKSNFAPSTFDKSQKIQSLAVSIAMIIFFILSSFTFFNMLYAFADCIGSIVCASFDVAGRDFLRALPLFLTFFMTLWTLLMLHDTFRRTNEEVWKKKVFGKAITILAFAGVNISYILAGLGNGTYLSIVEGSPSAIFPLDSLLYSLVYIAIGVMAIVYIKKLMVKYPYTVPFRHEPVKRARAVYCIFVTFWMLIAIFGFAGGIYSMFIYDFMHEYAFYGVGTILAYCLSPILLGVWEFYWNEVKEENKKEFLLPMALVSLGVSVVIVALYFISLGTNLDAPSNAGFGMFPVAFAASVNMATMIVVATPLIVSIVAVIKGAILRKAK